MPAFDIQATNAFWNSYDDPMIFRVIAFMETVENWTLDGNPELEKTLQDLGNQFDNLKKFELGREAQFVTLCAHIKTSRILRILQTIDTIEPGSASKVLMYAEEHNTPANPIAGLFLKRNIVFERLRLLARVFSADRFNLVMKALGATNA